jgi:hypothetical protein
MTVISNSTPLIYLAAIGKFDFLKALFGPAAPLWANNFGMSRLQTVRAHWPKEHSACRLVLTARS